MRIEVCVNRLEDISHLQSLPIDRIELCIELGCGGLTPSLSTIEKALTISKIPIHVLVRPRSGDFVYSEVTFATLLQDCVAIQGLGVAGIVTGGLMPEASLPLVFLNQLRTALSDCKLYFHRAFDDVAHPEQGIRQLIEIGFDGILSSGQKAIALEGLDLLIKWKEIANKNLVVMPGSGIDVSNVQRFQEAGFEWIHLSAKKQLSPSSSLFANQQYGVDINKLELLLEVIKTV